MKPRYRVCNAPYLSTRYIAWIGSGFRAWFCAPRYIKNMRSGQWFEEVT